MPSDTVSFGQWSAVLDKETEAVEVVHADRGPLLTVPAAAFPAAADRLAFAAGVASLLAVADASSAPSFRRVPRSGGASADPDILHGDTACPCA